MNIENRTIIETPHWLFVYVNGSLAMIVNLENPEIVNMSSEDYELGEYDYVFTLDLDSIVDEDSNGGYFNIALPAPVNLADVDHRIHAGLEHVYPQER